MYGLFPFAIQFDLICCACKVHNINIDIEISDSNKMHIFDLDSYK